VRPLLTLALAVVLAAGIYVLREVAANPNEGVTHLYVVPISLVAISFGAGPGILAALISLALFTVWDQTSADVDIGALGYSTRTVAFLLLGGLLGRFAADRAKLIAQLGEAARSDSLTGVLNHASFYGELSRELALSRRSMRYGTVMVLDIDCFKEINDKYGHNVGDEILIRVGHTLLRSLRQTDIVGRIGGDEFAAILPDTGQEGAELAARKFADLLGRHQQDFSARVEVSTGVATFEPNTDLTAEQAVAAADAAMYASKQRGSPAAPRQVPPRLFRGKLPRL